MIDLITTWDLQVLAKIHSFSSPQLDTFFKYITQTASFSFMCVLLVLLLAYQHTRRLGKQALVAELLQLAVGSYFLKQLIARPRPFVIDSTIELIVKAPQSYSFPSGHTSTAFALALVVIFSNCPKYIKITAFVWALIIGFSRLYLQVHFPTDVFFGALLGLACGYAVKHID